MYTYIIHVYVYMIKYIYIYGQIYEVVYTQHVDVGLFANGNLDVDNDD